MGDRLLMLLNPQHGQFFKIACGRAEIGHVWFSPAVHKSKVNKVALLRRISFTNGIKQRLIIISCQSLNFLPRQLRKTNWNIWLAYNGQPCLIGRAEIGHVWFSPAVHKSKVWFLIPMIP